VTEQISTQCNAANFRNRAGDVYKNWVGKRTAADPEKLEAFFQ
jgi:hypothetical protein